VGGGSVIDAFPPRTQRRTPLREAQLAALCAADAPAAFAALLQCTQAGVDTMSFARLFNLKEERIHEFAETAGAVLMGKDSRIALSRSRVAEVKHAVEDAVAKFHRESPQAAGIGVEQLRRSIAPELAQSTFTAILRDLATSHAIQIGGSTVRAPTHVATANAADDKMWRAVRPALERAGFALPAVRDLAASARLDEAKVRDFLHRKSRTGEVVRVTPERFALRGTIAQLAAVADRVAHGAPHGQFAAAEYRDAIGTGRTLAIEILECLDRLRITLRIGDLRRIGGDYVQVLGEAPRPFAKPAASAQAKRQ
jgi:selenocysteine-specific elongation factor